MAAPVFRNKSSADFGSGTSGSIAVPTGTASGDAVVGAISADGSGLTLSFSGGAAWTHATALSITNGDAQTFRLGYKSAGGAEGTNYTWNNSGGNACSVGVASYSGADSAVIDVAVSSNNPNSATPPSSPITATANGVTTVTDQDMVLVWYTVDLNGGVSGTWGAVSGATTRISQNPAQFSCLLMAEFAQSPAGATGNKTVTYTAAGNAGNPAAYTIAIKPASSGGSTVSGAGNPTQTATLTGSGASSASGAANPTEVATLTGSGASKATGDGTLAETATLTGSGASVASGVFTEASTATLTGASNAIASADGTLQQAATLNASGQSVASGAVSAQETASLTGAAQSIGSGDLYVQAALNAQFSSVSGAIASGDGSLSGAASLSAVGGSVAAGDISAGAAAVLSGAGAILVSAAGSMSMGATLTGASQSQTRRRVDGWKPKKRHDPNEELLEILSYALPVYVSQYM